MKFKVFFSSIVWGEEYLYYFLKFTIKSLLKKNNFNCDKISKDSTYVIYCKKKEAHHIKSNKTVEILKKKINLKIKYIGKANQKDKYSELGTYQKKAIEYAREHKFEVFMHIYPDSIISENFVKFCLEKHELKYDAVLSPGPLISSEAVKKIDDKSLLRYIFEDLHNFYQSFKFINHSNNSFIHEKNGNLYFVSKHLNINSLRIIKSEDIVKKINSFDEDILKVLKIETNKIYYVKSNHEIFIISLESKYSERSIKHKIANSYLGKNINDLYLYLNKVNNIYSINNFLEGVYIFSKSTSAKKIRLVHNSFKKKIKLICDIKKKTGLISNKDFLEQRSNYSLSTIIADFKKRNNNFKYYLLIIYISSHPLIKLWARNFYKYFISHNFKMIKEKNTFSLIEFFYLNKKVTLFQLLRA
jgi:hypothetical protein